MMSLPRIATLVVLAALLAVCGAVPALAQSTTTGTVSVTVLDPTGAAVPDAQLEIRDLSTNVSQKAATGSTGTYTFPNLTFGTYQLTVTAKGFQNQVFESVQVQTARDTAIHTTVKVGGTAETVT